MISTKTRVGRHGALESFTRDGLSRRIGELWLHGGSPFQPFPNMFSRLKFTIIVIFWHMMLETLPGDHDDQAYVKPDSKGTERERKRKGNKKRHRRERNWQQ